MGLRRRRRLVGMGLSLRFKFLVDSVLGGHQTEALSGLLTREDYGYDGHP